MAFIGQETARKQQRHNFSLGMYTLRAVFVHFNHFVDLKLNFHTNPYNLASSRLLWFCAPCGPTSTHIGWRVKKNFPETFKTQLEKNKNVIHRPGSVRIVRNSVPSVLVPPSAYGLQRYSRPWAQFLPIRTSQPVNNIIIWIYSCRNRWSADKYHITVSRA